MLPVGRLDGRLERRLQGAAVLTFEGNIFIQVIEPCKKGTKEHGNIDNLALHEMKT